MQIAVKTEDFKKVVSCTTRATSNKAIQPMLNNILIEGKKGSLKILATDLDLVIECKLPADVSEPGKITLPARKLDEIVSKAPGVDIRLIIDSNKLTKIVSDRSKFQVNGVSSDEFPEIINDHGTENVFSVKHDDLYRAISLTSFTASKFESSSVLSGINFEVKGDKFEVGAADGSRLARYIGDLCTDSKTPLQNNDKHAVIIPARAVVELERLLLNFKTGNDVINFYFLPGQIVFRGNDFTLSTRLIDGIFPAYDKLIPKEQSSKALFSKSSLLSSLERVAILANERTNVIKLTLTKKGKTAQLSANSPDYGDATDEVDVEYNGADLVIAFNYRYLSEALRNLQADNLKIELENPLSPLILKINEKVDYDYTYLIMPVQIR